MDFDEFLQQKLDYGSNSGFEPIWMPDFLFGFQEYLVNWSVKKGRAAIFADCGTGKGQPPTARVLTPNGWKAIGSLVIGDKVADSSGNFSNVVGIYPRGEQRTYRVHFSDRSSFVVDESHLHICRTNNDRQRDKPWRVLSTRDLLDTDNLRYGKNRKSRNYNIPVVGDIQFEERELPIDPYVIGVLLGDGYLFGNINISSADDEILNLIEERLPVGLYLKHKGKYDYKIMTGQTGNRRHPFRQAIVNLGLMKMKSKNKFIPEQYLYAGPFQRLELLRGLMDTDGYIEPSGTCQYYTISSQLADGVEQLIRGLGGIPTRHIKKTTGQPCHVLTFSLATHNPFHLSRKAQRWNENPRDNGRWIDRIEFEDVQETTCIAVDSLDSSYVTEHYIVTHNTPMQLVWGENVVRKTNRPVLVLTPLAVTGQTLEEAEKFGIEAYRATPRGMPRAIQVINYEQLHKYDARQYAGIVCDESSILKNFNGIRKGEITEFMRQIPYRLLCTATAAPNDWIELGTSSEALGYYGYMDMLTRFFQRSQTYALNDRGGRKEWHLKGHAAAGPFWQWLASWARAARRPSDLGFDDDGFILPALNERHTVVKANSPPEGMLFDIPAVSFQEAREVHRRTIQERCEMAAQRVAENGATSMVWCNLNDEGDLLEKLIPGSVQVSGSDPDEKKEDAAGWFVHGTDERRVLISKPSIFGFGLNFQHCQHMTYFPTYSYEQYYQATRRLWRFGQEKEVVVDLIYSDGGRQIMESVERKAREADKMFDNLVRYMGKELNIKSEYTKTKVEVPQWMK